MYSCGYLLAIMQRSLPTGSLSTLGPCAVHAIWMYFTDAIPHAVVTDNRMSTSNWRNSFRLFQATLMTCRTAKHVSVD